MRIRLEGTPDECDHAAHAIATVLDVQIDARAASACSPAATGCREWGSYFAGSPTMPRQAELTSRICAWRSQASVSLMPSSYDTGAV